MLSAVNNSFPALDKAVDSGHGLGLHWKALWWRHWNKVTVIAFSKCLESEGWTPILLRPSFAHIKIDIYIHL